MPEPGRHALLRAHAHAQQTLTILPADSIGQVAANLFAGAELDLPNPLIYANYSRQCSRAVRRSLLSRNAPRRASLPAVNLLRYPPGTLVNGDRSYLAVAGAAIVQEQVAPWCADAEQEAQRMRAGPCVDIGQPCLLLARFGENTWGHWVGELLPKAAIAERLSPGRFFYAVPWWTTEPGGEDGYAEAVLESLAAYGIAPERLVRLGGFKVYRFAALHDITGIFSDGMHPGALESLRCLVPKLAAGAFHPRIASLRRVPFSRAVYNAAGIEAGLVSQGFHIADFGRLSFLDQARGFAGAEMVVASLGSDVWACLFAPEGLPVVTLAPAAWEDGYFIRQFQRIGARHADIRGPSTLLDAGDPVRSPHLADPAEIVAGIEAARRSTPAEVTVDGEWMPRHLGAKCLHIRFAQGGNSDRFITGAWSDAEPTHRWSLGPLSTLTLPPGLPEGWLEIEGQGAVHPPHLPTRPFTVLADGKEAGIFEVIGRTRLFCRVPAATATLSFHHPLCPSPRQMGAGADDRPLGFGFESVCLYSRK
jgi:hypothetical protein